jgi:hypothetical protein
MWPFTSFRIRSTGLISYQLPTGVADPQRMKQHDAIWPAAAKRGPIVGAAAVERMPQARNR